MRERLHDRRARRGRARLRASLAEVRIFAQTGEDRHSGVDRMVLARVDESEDRHSGVDRMILARVEESEDRHSGVDRMILARVDEPRMG